MYVIILLFSFLFLCAYCSLRNRRNNRTGHRALNLTNNREFDKSLITTQERIEDVFPSFLPIKEHVPYKPDEYTDSEMIKKSADFYEVMSRRRGARHYKTDSVPVEAIKYAVMAAATSPSGNHNQPWTFVVVTDPYIKQAIRDIVEEEEQVNYDRRMSKQWVTDLSPLGLTWQKEYLTVAPALLLVFRETHGTRENGQHRNHYFSDISIGMASGILQSALQAAGLASLPTAPLNVGPRIRVLLNRPANEKLSLLFAVGRASSDCKVPDLRRKELDEFCVVV